MTNDSCAEPFGTTKTLLWPDLSFRIKPGPFRARRDRKSDRDHAPDDGAHVSRSQRQAMAACDRVHPCNSLAAPAESVFSGILFNILTALQAVQMGPASVNERPKRAQAASWTLRLFSPRWCPSHHEPQKSLPRYPAAIAAPRTQLTP